VLLVTVSDANANRTAPGAEVVARVDPKVAFNHVVPAGSFVRSVAVQIYITGLEGEVFSESTHHCPTLPAATTPLGFPAEETAIMRLSKSVSHSDTIVVEVTPNT
jgi:hypothetical protein